MIGTAYVMRAIGDVGSPVLTWLSPIGWFQGMYAFSGLRWWPLVLLVLAAAAVAAAALWAFGRRDHGAGVLAARPGPARASRGLTTPLGLVWRLQRGALIGWVLGLFLTGLSYGSLGSDVGALLGDSSTTEDMFIRGGSDLTAGFYATAILMLALMCCGYAISTAMRPRHEEASGLVEVLLATGLSRSRWLGAHVVFTVLGTLAVVSAAGLGLGIGYALSAGDPATGASYVLATLPYAAPVLVMSALARLLYGLAPRLAGLAWVALVFALVVMLFGALLQIPEWVQDISPFHHLALTPAEDFRWQPMLGLMLVAAATSLLGQAMFRRRDVEVR